MKHSIRLLIASAAVLNLEGSAQAAPRLQTYLIPDRAAELTGLLGSTRVLATDGDAAVVAMPDDEIDALASLVHETFDACGGFIDVGHEVDTGATATDILRFNAFLKRKMHASARSWPTVSYQENIATLVAQVDPDRMWAFLSELSGFDNRSATTSMGGQAAQFLADRATAVAGALPGFSLRIVATRSYPQQPSVVVTLAGSDPSLPHVVIGGHMDTFSPNRPGADDDGTGSSVVMEALMTIAAQGASFRHSIDFIWYAAEERGLVGSGEVVRDFDLQNIEVLAAIQFDMTGYKSPRDRYDVYLIDDYIDAGLNRSLEDILGIYTPNARIGHTECGYACSDHASWMRNGVPAVFPFESSFDNLNSSIHTQNDRMSLIDKDHAGIFAQAAVAFLGQVAGLE